MANKRKGFTLIELLVVIAIIALLLAILMPGLRMAKEIAKNIVCRTNIRSLTLGFRMYVESNDNKLLEHGDPALGTENLWLLEIEDQLGEVNKVRYCPSTKLNPNPSGMVRGDSKLSWRWSIDVVEPESGSYGYSAWLYSDRRWINAEDWEAGAWLNANPRNSASVPVFADSKWVDFFVKDTNTCPDDYNLSEDSGWVADILRILMDRHGDEINVGFIDGHVDSVKLENLWSLKWSKDFETEGVKTRVGGDPIYKR